METNIDERVNETLKKCLNGSSFSFTVKEPPTGTFFIQILYFLDVNIDGEDLALVLKLMPWASESIMYAPHYFNEIYMYKEVLPQLGKLAGKLVPKIIYSSPLMSLERMNFLDTVIVLEDLTKIGFKMTQQNLHLNIDEIRTALVALGHWHGEFYSLKLSNPKAFEKVARSFCTKQMITRKDELRAYMRGLSNACMLRTLKRFIILPNHKCITTRCQKLLEQLIRLGDDFLMMRSIEPEEPCAVVCHGDYNRNNLMFRYKEGVAVECKILDLQTPIYSSPAKDLSFLLFMNTNSKMRRQFWSLFWDDYYHALVQRIQYNQGCDFQLPDFLSLKSLKEDFKKHCYVGFQTATFFSYCYNLERKETSAIFERFLNIKNTVLFDEVQFFDDELERLESDFIAGVLNDLTFDYIAHFYDSSHFD